MADDNEEQPAAGPVQNVAQIIRNVVTSAVDAKIGTLYINSCQAIPARKLLEEMGHKQTPTPIQTDMVHHHLLQPLQLHHPQLDWQKNPNVPRGLASASNALKLARE